MLATYTAKYTKTNSGYMGQLIEWQEVITECETLEDCRALLQDAIKEMILAYRQQNQEIPRFSGLKSLLLAFFSFNFPIYCKFNF